MARLFNEIDPHLEPGFVWAIAPGREARRFVTEQEAVDYFRAFSRGPDIVLLGPPNRRGKRKRYALLPSV